MINPLSFPLLFSVIIIIVLIAQLKRKTEENKKQKEENKRIQKKLNMSVIKYNIGERAYRLLYNEYSTNYKKPQSNDLTKN